MKYTLRKCIIDDVNFIFELKKFCLKWYIIIVYGWDDIVQYEKPMNELKHSIDYIKFAEKANKRIIIKTYKENPAKKLYTRLGFKVYHEDGTHIYLEINQKGKV